MENKLHGFPHLIVLATSRVSKQLNFTPHWIVHSINIILNNISKPQRVYLYTCICIFVFVYLYLYTCICIFAFVYLYLYICICIFVFVYMFFGRRSSYSCSLMWLGICSSVCTGGGGDSLGWSRPRLSVHPGITAARKGGRGWWVTDWGDEESIYQPTHPPAYICEMR